MAQQLEFDCQIEGMARSGMELMMKTAAEKCQEFFPNDRAWPSCSESMAASICFSCSMCHSGIPWFMITGIPRQPAGLHEQTGRCLPGAWWRASINVNCRKDPHLWSTGNRSRDLARERFAAEHVVNTGNPKRLINEILDKPDLWPYKEREIITRHPFLMR